LSAGPLLDRSRYFEIHIDVIRPIREKAVHVVIQIIIMTIMM
jgi:hypothetical protein